MKKLAAFGVASLISVSGLLAVAMPSLAAAATSSYSWDRSHTYVTGRTVTHVGSCTAGSGCNGTKTTTGAQGNVRTRQFTAVGNGQGSVNATIIYTGPRGHSMTFRNY